MSGQKGLYIREYSVAKTVVLPIDAGRILPVFVTGFEIATLSFELLRKGVLSPLDRS